jgi:hypothetical protein
LTVEQPVTDATPTPPDADPEQGRRHPSTIGGMFYLGVLGLTLVGIGIVATGDWRAGIRWVAGGLLLASAVRLVLPSREAGMLAVRHRAVDCLMLAVVGVLLLFLASTIPNQPL